MTEFFKLNLLKIFKKFTEFFDQIYYNYTKKFYEFKIFYWKFNKICAKLTLKYKFADDS